MDVNIYKIFVGGIFPPTAKKVDVGNGIVMGNGGRGDTIIVPPSNGKLPLFNGECISKHSPELKNNGDVIILKILSHCEDEKILEHITIAHSDRNIKYFITGNVVIISRDTSGFTEHDNSIVLRVCMRTNSTISTKLIEVCWPDNPDPADLVDSDSFVVNELEG